jgi:cytochrome b subunit of formate dehydrogenase
MRCSSPTADRPRRDGGGRRRAAAAAAALLLALAGHPRAADAAAPSDRDCLQCHADDPTMTMDRAGKEVSIYVRASVLQASAHAKVTCVECHVGFDPEEMPHKAHITPVDCMACHRNAASKHPVHGAVVRSLVKRGAPSAACKNCHGTHDVKGTAAADTTTNARAVNATCAACHAEQASHYERSAHGQAAAAGEPGAPTCVTCHRKPISPAATGGVTTAALKIEQENLCLSCHLDDPKVRARMAPGAGFIAAYEQSVHGKALQEGNVKSATCIDCHGSHEMAKGLDPASRANKQNIAATCGKCHGKIAATFNQSVHGVAVAKGVPDAPSCTDCHGEHTIAKAKSPESPVAPANVSERVCSPCHSSVRLTSKYGIRNDRFKTFSDSFHGLAIKGGSVSAANCASCHGAHDILPSKDPRSTINPAHLAATCGKCHPGATAAFATGKVHLEVTEKDEPLLFWIATIYTILIGLTIGGMAAHNALDFYRKSRHRLRVRRGLEAGPEPAGRGLYLRMTRSERLQHGALVVSFTVLVLTGFALRFPNAWLVENVHRYASVLFDWRGIVHRIAGVVLVGAALFHIGYLTLTARGREFFRDIMLRPGDLKDVTSALRFYAGRRRERPRFGRFSYIEKSEYWALVWGTIVMAGTGVILWFQDPFIALLSKLGWDAARMIHVYEAVLATLAILVWHLYFVIFNPDVYPMNLSWLTGTLSEEEMEDEHPLELEALRERSQGEGAEPGGGKARPDRPRKGGPA